MMNLYIGHFLFDSLQVSPDAPEYGRFTCVVEAANETAAAKRLRHLIERAVDKTSYLKAGMKVYLHRVVEISKLPAEGVMTQIELSQDRPADTMVTSLPHPDTDTCDVLVWGNPEEEGAVRMKPFLEIGQPKSRIPNPKSS
jgi:acetylornithine/succinyldiaminopimelate/putrescine aminotransferase